MKNIVIIVIGTILVSLYVNNKDYVMIPATSIRMRVIAASNGVKDQNEKLIVKSALEETINNLKIPDTYNSVDSYMQDNKELIDESIRKKIKSDNYNISFSSNYGYNYFPEKTWKNVVYPSGNYKSYVITIGEGKGENWWCVMYPPLCLLDEDKNDFEYRSLIKDILSQYN